MGGQRQRRALGELDFDPLGQGVGRQLGDGITRQSLKIAGFAGHPGLVRVEARQRQ